MWILKVSFYSLSPSSLPPTHFLQYNQFETVVSVFLVQVAWRLLITWTARICQALGKPSFLELAVNVEVHLLDAVLTQHCLLKLFIAITT